MNEHERPDNLPEIPTRVVCHFHGGRRVVRIINWNNRNAVKRFSHLSRECMTSGPDAWTKAERIPESAPRRVYSIESDLTEREAAGLRADLGLS